MIMMDQLYKGVYYHPSIYRTPDQTSFPHLSLASSPETLEFMLESNRRAFVHVSDPALGAYIATQKYPPCPTPTAHKVI